MPAYGTLAGTCTCLQFERLAGIHRAAPHTSTGGPRNRDRLPCQCRFVENGVRGHDNAIGRNDLACPHEQDIPRLHCICGNIGNAIPIAAVGNARRLVHERLQIPLGAGHGKILKDRAARVHRSHDDCGERRP